MGPSRFWVISINCCSNDIEFAKSLYHIFLPKQKDAIQNAQRLFEENRHLNFHEQNPCTTVFQLVEELNKCLRI